MGTHANAPVPASPPPTRFRNPGRCLPFPRGSAFTAAYSRACRRLCRRMRSRSVVGNHSESKPFSQIPEDETSSPTPNYSSGPVCPGSGSAPGSAWGAWLCLIGVPQEVAAGPPAALEDDKLQSPGAHGAAGVPPGDAGACSWPPRGSPVRMLVSSTAGAGAPSRKSPLPAPRGASRLARDSTVPGT